VKNHIEALSKASGISETNCEENKHPHLDGRSSKDLMSLDFWSEELSEELSEESIRAIVLNATQKQEFKSN
jgi:hypothetical protein